MARVIENRDIWVIYQRNILSAHHHQRARLSRNRSRIRIGNMTTTILDDMFLRTPCLSGTCGLHPS